MKDMDPQAIELARRRLDIAYAWIEGAMSAIMIADAPPGEPPQPFVIRVAKDNARLDLAPAGGEIAEVAFRHRRLERSKSRGRPVFQITFWTAPEDGETEYGRVLHVPVGDFAAGVWYESAPGGRDMMAAAILDLNRFRALPVRVRQHMEEPGPPAPSFVGFDISSLIGWKCARAWTPTTEFFAANGRGARAQTPGQEALV